MRSKSLSFVAVALAVPAAAIWSVPPVSATAASSSGVVAAGARVTPPNVKIEGAPANFAPRKITVKGVSGPACTPQHYSFRVTNKTAVSQQLEYNGAPFTNPIPPGKHIPVCDEDGINFTLGLESNGAAVLKVKG